VHACYGSVANPTNGISSSRQCARQLLALAPSPVIRELPSIGVVQTQPRPCANAGLLHHTTHGSRATVAAATHRSLRWGQLRCACFLGLQPTARQKALGQKGRVLHCGRSGVEGRAPRGRSGERGRRVLRRPFASILVPQRRQSRGRLGKSSISARVVDGGGGETRMAGNAAPPAPRPS
jgi:hypothetical protein